MTYEISLSEDGTYIRLHIFDAVNGEMERKLAENVIKEAKLHKINKFLIDVRGTPNIASVAEQYRFGYEDMNRFGLERDSRIAILADTDDTSHNFIETVFVNAGYICRIFADEDAALKWFEE